MIIGVCFSYANVFQIIFAPPLGIYCAQTYFEMDVLHVKVPEPHAKALQAMLMEKLAVEEQKALSG